MSPVHTTCVTISAAITAISVFACRLFMGFSNRLTPATLSLENHQDRAEQCETCAAAGQEHAGVGEARRHVPRGAAQTDQLPIADER
jgi:hypothetical protein